MPFTGKATYDAGATLPEIAEDVADIIGILAAHETPLLDHLGDPRRAARSTIHEWLEEPFAPQFDFIDQTTFIPSPLATTSVVVEFGDRIRVGDQLRVDDTGEHLLVAAINNKTLTVQRAHGGGANTTLANDQKLTIIGNASLEGADPATTDAASNRRRRLNYTQIFSAAVQVSGSQLAVDTIGVRDELDYQLQERLRELLRDLEATVINSKAQASNAQGSGTVRRTMNGMLSIIQSNRFSPGADGMPDGDGAANDQLNEPLLNAALRAVWDTGGRPDTIVVGGAQKRRINAFITPNRAYGPADDAFRDMVSYYESDFGLCRVLLSRWVPNDKVLLLDSARAAVLPLAGRSFQFKRLASTGDSETGQVLGEYTLELMNEAAHGAIDDLAA